MSEAKKYSGGCHCGAVRYDVEVDLSQPVTACNCSICSKRAHLLSFVPASKFQLLKGEDKLTDYQFNKMHIHHNFCSKCGIESFARGAMPDGTAMIAVNARCLDGVDPETLTVKHFNGRAL